MQIFTSVQKTMLFVLLSIIFSCSTKEIKGDNFTSLKFHLPENIEPEALIQLTKTSVQKVQKVQIEKKLSKTSTTKAKKSKKISNTSTYKKITPDQEFEKSCIGPRILQNRYLEATCDGKHSRLDLNNCLYAEGGVLIYDTEGYFYDSCSKCRLNYPTWQGKKQPINFECKCYDDDLNEIKTNINLQDFVYFDGKLKCGNIDPRKLPKAKEIDTQCKNSELTDSKKFITSCKKDGKYVNQKFTLENCMSNNNGHFAHGKHFARTCHLCDIKREKGVYVITCDCEDARQSRRREYAALNEFFEIENNKIICHDPNKKKNTNVDSGAIIDYNKELSASDNFMRNCQNFSFEENIFAAQCGSNKKLLELDLNKCIANINGDLKFAKNGKYGNSCEKCSVESNGWGIYFLKCTCKTIEKRSSGPAIAHSNEKRTFVSLSEKIIITQDTKQLGCLPNLILENEKNVVNCENRSFLK